MGVITVSSETAFTAPRATIYDFVSDPRNWPKTYPDSALIEGIDRVPLQVGDIWAESGEAANQTPAKWRLITAEPGQKFAFQSVGPLPGGSAPDFTGLFTITYTFTEPAPGVTLFHRSMSLEMPKHETLPPDVLAVFEPRFIDAYHEAIKKFV